MKSHAILLAALGTAFAAPGGTVVSGLGADAAANRAAIQRAVDAASAAGGGRVEIPPGTWPTGSIELKSGVELHLPKGATLKGSVNRADYNANDAFPENFWSDGEEWSGGHLIWARCADDIAITGEGTINGNGPAFFGEPEEDSRWPFYKYGLKLQPIDREWFRPGPMVAIFRCRRVRLAGVSLDDTPAWTCHIRCCDGVDIRGVRINADVTIANSDGFSIDCSRNVKVADCTLHTGDDGFAIRASCRHHAATNFCENIAITNCDVWSCCHGIRYGIGTGTIRNVRVDDTRIHEAALPGIHFTPAWVDAGRNCYIEDIVHRNCLVADCVRGVGGGPSGGDSKVTGIRFENCVFRSLLPIQLAGGERCQFTFVDCVREPIERVAVRHHRGWHEYDILVKHSVFAEVSGDTDRIRIENCLPRPFGERGVLMLCFDDRNFADWERAIPLFAKYGAHATFFVNGEFTPDAVRAAKKLLEAGHSIGLHGLNHANVPDLITEKGAAAYFAAEIDKPKRQCDVSYIPVRSFAYPNNSRNDESDKVLEQRFLRLRAGIPGVRPYDPKGEKRGELKPLVSDERLFFPVAELPKRRVLGGVILGEAYATDIDDVVACVKRVGERKEALLFTSHGIHPDAKHIDMKTEWLEKILAAAKEADVSVLAFDEIPLE